MCCTFGMLKFKVGCSYAKHKCAFLLTCGSWKVAYEMHILTVLRLVSLSASNSVSIPGQMCKNICCWMYNISSQGNIKACWVVWGADYLLFVQGVKQLVKHEWAWTSMNVAYVFSTSWPWESIWSTLCHPMRSKGPSPGSTQHRPSHKPHIDARASGTHQCLSPGTVVAVQVEEKKTQFSISDILCLRSHNWGF